MSQVLGTKLDKFHFFKGCGFGLHRNPGGVDTCLGVLFLVFILLGSFIFLSENLKGEKVQIIVLISSC